MRAWVRKLRARRTRIARSCPHSNVEEWATGRPRLKHLGAHAAIPVVRAILRYSQSRRLRASVWRRTAGPLWGHDHPFVVEIAGGSKFAGTTAETVGASIYFTGTWEKPLTRWLAARLRPGDTFVDVGAHFGYFTLVAAQLVGDTGRVVAIEPLDTTFERLQRNVELNQTRNIRLVNVAASDRRSKVVLWAHPRNLGATTLEPPNPEFQRGSAVDALPLTEILDADEIAKARVIKIDVEGSEGAVVAGMADLLSATRQDVEILVEVHRDRVRHIGDDFEDLVETLELANFRGVQLPESGTSNVVAEDGRVVTTEQVVFSRI